VTANANVEFEEEIIKVDTRFGVLEVPKSKIFKFPFGIIGFESHQEYIMFVLPNKEITILQAVDSPDIAFPLVDPFVLVKGYKVELKNTWISALKVEDKDEIVVFAIATFRRGKNGLKMTLNLKAPVVVNFTKKVGAQIILEDANWPIRYEVELKKDKNVEGDK